ncbi:MAG: hypothetical protein II931_06975 [Clostridia bacterium]|nr:hypothetical protein [Clostridia bacterium]
MSSYSHRGYEQRSGGYGRRRHKASGFKRKPSGGEAAKGFVIFILIIVMTALVFVFFKYLKPFVNSLRTQPTVEVVETFDTAVPDSPDTPIGEFDKVDDKIFVSNGSGYLMFKGIDDTAVNYAATLNSIVSSVDDDITVYNMVIPTNTEFGLDGDMSEYTNSQRDNLDKINSAVMDNVVNVDVYKTLDLHSSEYIYYRTDESLTSLGAYYVYREFAQTADFNPDYIYSIDKLSEKKGSIGRFEGSFIRRTTGENVQPHGNQELFNNADSIDFYKLPVHYNCDSVDVKTGKRTETDLFTTDKAADDPLSVFPAKDTELLEISNVENNNDEKLLIVKDHIGEPIIGYLVPAYEEVYVVDAQLYKGNLSEYIRSNDITHILILNGISNANNSLYCQRLRDLFDSGISG